MQIPPDKIHEIVERTDLVALISRHVELKRSGNSFKGLCPFHGEKTPSFHVHPDKKFFKCFGCEAGGDAIAFLQRFTGRSFVEVVRDLAREAGVSLEEREDPAARERAQLLEANEQARRHFEERLWSSPLGRAGREHLQKRGVGEALARQFCLGYSANAWNDLGDRLVKEGILEWGARAGLCAPRRGGDGFYDVFRGRLMIPIRSPEGRTVAFGGRLVEENPRPGGESGPKYLNSRESPLYRKSEILFALDLAKDDIRRQKTAILVEGYFDVIGLYSAGIRNAVALCSTALTGGHLAALARADAKELVLLLDGDEAGVRAVERLAAPIFAAGASARVACLPTGDDPDTFALREGKGGVDRLIGGAPALSTWLLERALPRGKGSSFEEKLAALARFKPILEGMPVGIARSLLLAEVAGQLGLPESEVRASLNQDVKAPKPARPAVPAPAAPKPAVQTLDSNEEFFVALLLADASLRSEPEAGFVGELGSLEVRLALSTEQPGDQQLQALSPVLREKIQRRLLEIQRTLSEPDARRRALRDSCNKVRLTRVEERLTEKRAELGAAQASGNEEELGRLQAEFSQLSELRKRLRARSGGGAPAKGGGT